MNILQKKSKRPHVVIVGAGFGGLKTAQLLAKHPIDITIIDKNNYHLFQPLLYQISTAGLSVDDIAQFANNAQHDRYFVKSLTLTFIWLKSNKLIWIKKLL